MTGNRTILIVLIAIDTVLILTHAVTGVLLDSIPPLFNIARDGSLGELFNYAKWLALVAILLTAYRQTHLPYLAAFAVLFAVVFLDDALQFHETAGGFLAQLLGLPDGEGIKGKDIGEAMAFLGLGLIVVPIVAFGILRTPGPERRNAYVLLGLVIALTVFGGVVDLAHGLVSGISVLPQIFDLVEDGGEMIVASLTLAFAAGLAQKARVRA